MSTVSSQTNSLSHSLGTPSVQMSTVAGTSNPTQLERTSKATSKKIDQIITAGASKRRQLTTTKKSAAIAGAIICIISMGLVITAAILYSKEIVSADVALLEIGLPSWLLGFVGLAVWNCIGNHYEIVSEDKVRQFSKDVESLTFPELRKKHRDWYCIGAPYHGPVSQISGSRYEDLITYGILTRELSNSLQTIFRESLNIELEKTRALQALEVLSVMPEPEKLANIQRINAQHDERQLELEKRFIALRSQLI